MDNIIFFPTKEAKHMIEVLDAARYFLSLGPMQHKKLQKLCYYAQAWYLALNGRELLDTEFEAWVHGPVSPRLYVRYKDWGGLVIPQMPYDSSGICEEIKSFLRIIYNMYKNYSGNDLEQLTHQEEPWQEAREGFAPTETCRVRISNDTMRRFYGGLLNNG